MNQRKNKRVPPSVDGIQVNFCHNPDCENYGIAAVEDRKDHRYKKVAVKKLQPAIQCKSCGNISQLKSNRAISDELNRICDSPVMQRAVRHTGYSCPNPECTNYLAKLSTNRERYRARGVSSVGNPRFNCKACNKTFTVGSTKHREGVKNFTNSHVGVFKHLVIGTPLRGIEEFYETTNTETLRKIDLFYERCMLFAHERESRLASLSIPRMQLACDKQDYLANWNDRKDKRTTQLSAIGTSDRWSGYVFGMEINYDASTTLEDIVRDKEYFNDLKLQFPFRSHARVWTPDEIPTLSVITGEDDQRLSSLEDLNLSQRLIDGDVPPSLVALGFRVRG